MTITFHNPTTLDLAFVRAFAVSAKETENPIGFFGTGMKYALAILAKAEAQVTISLLDDNGARQNFHLCTKKKIIRGKEFHFVCLGGEELPFTTDLGKQWQLWMAYRELYCNALDEGGTVTDGDNFPSDSGTIIRVTHEEIEKVHREKDIYFLSGEPLGKLEDGPYIHTLNKGNPKGVFKRGIFVGGLQHPCMFTYNLVDGELSEDRLLRNLWMLENDLVKGFVKSNDPALLRQVLQPPKGTFEAQLDYDRHYHPSDIFMSVMKELLRNNRGAIPESAIVLYEKHEKIEIETFVPTKVQQKMLDKAIGFVESLGHTPTDYPINLVVSLGKNILGEARNGQIYLSRRLFEAGTKAVASCLLEEYIHLKLQFKDNTYEMQTYLFDTIISLREELNGEPL